MNPARIALVVPNLMGGGGLPSVGLFLLRVIERDQCFKCELISLATSASDSASLRLVSPSSWFGKPCIERTSWEGREVCHVGARFVELEFQRYSPRPVLTSMLEAFDLVQIVAGSPACALVARDYSGPLALQVASLAREERKERFRHERGLAGAWRRTMTRVTHRLDRKGTRIADRIFVENRWMQSALSQWTDPERIELAPPGIDTECFRPVDTVAKGPGDRGYILSVGRFGDPRKCVGLLLDAYAGLQRRLPGCPGLVLAGQSSPPSDQLSRLPRLGLDSAVSWKGEVSKDELAELYRGASLFVLSSAEEGLGLVLLEAMASGVPVVATRTAGARQVVAEGRSGFLVPVGDAHGLAAAMEKVLREAPLRQAMGRTGRKIVETRYSEEIAARPFLDAYRESLATSPRRPDRLGSKCRV